MCPDAGTVCYGELGAFLSSGDCTVTVQSPVNTMFVRTCVRFYWGSECSECCFRLRSLNAELNPIYHLLALFGDHHILHVSG